MAHVSIHGLPSGFEEQHSGHLLSGLAERVVSPYFGLKSIGDVNVTLENPPMGHDDCGIHAKIDGLIANESIEKHCQSHLDKMCEDVLQFLKSHIRREPSLAYMEWVEVFASEYRFGKRSWSKEGLRVPATGGMSGG